MTPVCELRTLDVINSLGLWITLATLGRELKALDAMSNTRLWLA